MQLICLDTQILIWGIKQQCTPGQEAKIETAKAFIKQCYQDNVQVMVPSIVVAEFLIPIPVEKHNSILINLSNSFMIPSFDNACASIFAEIWNSKKNIKEEFKNGGVTREKFKADCLILAVAIKNKADCIYSYDDGLVKIAKGYIKVKEMPTYVEQLECI